MHSEAGRPPGRIRHAGELEDAALGRLREWISTYLAEVEDQAGRPRGSIQRPRSVVPMSEPSHIPEEQLPSVQVVCPGTADTLPGVHGDGCYEATYDLGVLVLCMTNDQAATRRLCQLYGAAVRACLLQGRSLGGACETLVWRGESFDDVPTQLRRQFQASLNRFEAVMGDVVSWQAGPRHPVEPPVQPVDPLPEWPDAVEATPEVEKVPLTEEVPAHG